MNFILALIALVIFSFVDYYCYNKFNHTHIHQVILGGIYVVGFIYFHLVVSLILAVLCWWTFISDLMFYGFAESFKWFPNDAGSFKTNIYGNLVTWAWWTPIGIIYGANTEKPIPGILLITQAFVGLFASLYIGVILR